MKTVEIPDTLADDLVRILRGIKLGARVEVEYAADTLKSLLSCRSAMTSNPHGIPMPCEYCPSQAKFIINKHAVCFQHRSRA